ncbi:LysR family transcriptional regulator [Methylophaga lonarensis MPL]|uniref:LysR family transcriptional regulator n=1 Tax=Methylophaga lonarensis MPL TaxID=1286106 RepID=M7NU09_9GAMM|nr:CysB family HTH-type transcriptional regulator [Methylophaga lonarensis]EMR12248.1 LysR family transcriptional regulator [Methylophaga lonarensis MPL]
MNFQQLRIIRETVKHDFNLTEVANHLYTSQSGVSKHIKDLEDELGVELYIRKGKRLTGLTEPGKEMLPIVERMLLDAGNVKRLAEHYSQRDTGTLTLATTHTQARYVLPQVITPFKLRYPKVHLKLHQGSPDEIVEMLVDGRADIGIATEALGDIPELASFPYYSWHHAVIVPVDHPLSKLDKLTLADLAAWPIVTYHEGFTGRASIDRAFTHAGIEPDVVMSALDADVIKSYVELGLGIGIVAAMAFNAERDNQLQRIDTAHLFDANQTKIAVRRGHYLRQFAYDLINLCAPELDIEQMRREVAI